MNTDLIDAISAKVSAAIAEATGTEVPTATWDTVDRTSHYPFGLHYHDVTQAMTGEAAKTVNSTLAALDSYISETNRGADSLADAAIGSIPAAFLPDGPDGPRTDESREQAETDLEILVRARNARSFQRADVRYPGLIERYLPTAFEPEGEGEAADAERALAAWGAMRAARDEIVRRALSAGVTKTRVHEITGISRATIDRIPGI